MVRREAYSGHSAAVATVMRCVSYALLALAAGLATLAGCWSGGGAGNGCRERFSAAAVRASVRRAGSRDARPGGAADALRRGAARSRRPPARREAHGLPRCATRRRVRRRAGPARARVPPEVRVRTGFSTSRTPRATAATPSPGIARTAGRRCGPAARSCSPCPTRTGTTTAASSRSAATGCCTRRSVTAAPVATPRIGRRTWARSSASCSVSTSRSSGADWAIAGLGLRNAWRFSFDRATGDLYLGDVGQGAIEEVSFTPAGQPGPRELRLGSLRGLTPLRGRRAGSGQAGLSRSTSTGGARATARSSAATSTAARPAQRERGRYIFGDYCSGIVWSLTVRSGAAKNVRRELFRIQGLTSFGESASGELYATTQDGVIYRLT